MIRSAGHYKVGKIEDKRISVNLICMGVVPGKIIHLVRKAPFGGAWFVSCDGKRMGVSAAEIEKLDLTAVTIL